MKKVYILLLSFLMMNVAISQQITLRGERAPLQTKQNNAINALKTSRALYFYDDFSSGDFSNWTISDEDGDGNNWWISNMESDFVGQGNAAVSNSWTSADGPLTPNNYMTSIAIDLTSAEAGTKLAWNVAGYETDYYAEHYAVYVTTSNVIGDITAATPVFEETLPAEAGGVIVSREVDLSSYVGQTVYVTFRHYDCEDINLLTIDDVQISAPSTDDAGITAITAPSNNTSCVLSASEVVTVTIENFGSNDMSNFDVTYNVSGAITSTVTETYAETITAGTSVEYTFAATVDLSAIGEYTITAYASLTGDGNSSNDATTIDVYSFDVSIVFTINNNQYFSESSWMIIDQISSNIVASGYVDGADYTAATCVNADGCYDFVIYDSFGDGLINEDESYGTYTVSFNGTEIASGGEFESDETTVGIGDGCSTSIEKTNEKHINVYPNPAKDVINVSVDNATITVYNILGKVVKVADKTNTINVSDLAEGNYIVKVQTEKSVVTRQVVLTK